jgi:hypothetical protein
MGKWNLSLDENSFTLSRLSDDQITIIAQIAKPVDTNNINENNRRIDSRDSLEGVNDSNPDEFEIINSKIPSEKKVFISGEDFYKEIDILFNNLISLLNPSEILNLITGKATLETLAIVLRLIQLKHKNILPFLDTESKISNIFLQFGKATGLEQLKNKIEILTATQNISRKAIEKIPCPPFDNIFDFRDRLLKKTLDDTEATVVLERIVASRRKKFLDTQNALIDLEKGISNNIANILCGTGKNPSGTRNPAVEDSLNSTINLMFENVKMTFDQEIFKFIDSKWLLLIH